MIIVRWVGWGVGQTEDWNCEWRVIASIWQFAHTAHTATARRCAAQRNDSKCTDDKALWKMLRRNHVRYFKHFSEQNMFIQQENNTQSKQDWQCVKKKVMCDWSMETCKPNFGMPLWPHLRARRLIRHIAATKICDWKEETRNRITPKTQQWNTDKVRCVWHERVCC